MVYSQVEDNTVTFKTPSDKFIDITLQAHKGLPRYGEIYYRRGITPYTNNNAFKFLVEMKYMDNIYADMDMGKITKKPLQGTNDKKELHSYLAQTNLLNVASHVCSEEALQDYFCPENSKTKPCRFIDRYGQRKNIGIWGGFGANEFKQMRSYTSFVKDYLKELQSWSATFFKSDMQDAYLVGSVRLIKPYDFKNEGYWITPPLASLGNGPLLNVTFVAITEKEKKLTNQRNQVLFAMSPKEAKKMALEKEILWSVVKGRVVPTSRNEAQIRFDFELESDSIEIYRDPSLLQKIGELSISNLISKY
ncbi:MAG: hypothetical protein AAGB24_09750 [Bacteroidota bacterium]